MTLRVHVDAFGLSVPGLDGPSELQAHLAGAPLDVPEDWTPSQATLAPRQARRLSTSIRSAIAAAEQIDAQMSDDAGWVFASSTGEGDTLNVILSALCAPEVMIQPIRFQNAVHNAAQGQWSVARGAKGPATSISAFDATVGAGLLKAAMQVVLERRAVGLVCFDAPLPPPLHEKRAFDLQMAVAFALSPERSERTICALDISRTEDGEDNGLAALPLDPRIAQSRNPALQAIPLLVRLMDGGREPLVLQLPGPARLMIRFADDTNA